MIRAARIEQGKVADLWMVPALDCFGDLYTLVAASDEVVLGANYSNGVFTNPLLPLLTREQIIAQHTRAVQQRLDDFARTRDYESILSATSYVTSSVVKFQNEARHAVIVRDNTWTRYFEILAAVRAGARSMPTLDGLLAELPVLTWPN